ncbi:AbrB/MazE/SpoVT family DNA-binding domain-containing protein [Pseudomonas brassicacearum]|uniref:AbrB/MazE/SpoVT family DNA-binding domain-containing protein n=1 Tax=Pseudomonas brassicacearum subsp. neoaurantiaca TaxID=494916 RepID=A0A7V8ZU13_9PSED|nr:AbrB/MazE/SpoVT family DNA-binding domain-containing protein [Pseudomonas brassicacearum]MBA1379663.1 AbrB/MazE/SpoVT family DNA-binding domain-containing protein [Pseudomonas brassicacearum subsp. neoaurantiaca]
MSSTVASNGRVTIPKAIREALQLVPGCAVEFSINALGEVVLRAVRHPEARDWAQDCFEVTHSRAKMKRRTGELMARLPARYK